MRIVYVYELEKEHTLGVSQSHRLNDGVRDYWCLEVQPLKLEEVLIWLLVELGYTQCMDIYIYIIYIY